MADQPSWKGAGRKKVRQNAAALDQQLIEKEDECLQKMVTIRLKMKKGCNAERCKPLNLLVPEVGIEPTLSQGKGDFESLLSNFI